MELKTNIVNSNRNPNLKVDSKETKTITIIEREKDNLKNKIKNDEYITNNNSNNNIKINNNTNLIKLMKTVHEYKSKNNKSRYENYLNSNANVNQNVNLNTNINLNNNDLSGKKSNNDYISNIINNFNDEDKNMIFKKKLKNSYNPGYSEMTNLKCSNENKILQNITQNTLTMYSIYIISHYFSDFKKIGLSKIVLLNKNNKSIPVICSNTNCGKDTNKLFNISGNNKNIENNKPFITEFKNNIYINFYINNIQSNNIRYIQITNYSDIKNKVSPVGKI